MKTFSITFLLAFFFSFSLFAQSLTELHPTNNTTKYDEAEAIIEIEKIYQKLLKGEKFEELVLKFSQDPGTFLKGGVIRPTSLDSLDEDYAKVVLKLKMNEISKPFKTFFGYHIVQLIDKKGDDYFTRHILIRSDLK